MIDQLPEPVSQASNVATAVLIALAGAFAKPLFDLLTTRDASAGAVKGKRIESDTALGVEQIKDSTLR